jgi:hypothetical protein
MAKAYPRKKLNDFLRNKQTKAYVEALSVNTGIPALELIEVKVGGIHSGTWAHPDLSVKFAAWLSPELEVWAMRTLFELISDRAKAVQPKADFVLEIDQTKAILGLIDSAMQGVKLGSTEAETQNLLAGMRLSLIGDRLPQLRSATMEAHKLLAATTTTDEIWLTPTSIGKELGVSARTVNNLLIDAGFQTRVPKEDRVKGEPDYRPTEKGDRYSSNTLATGNSGDSTTYQHVKWAASVVGILREFMSAIAS